MTDQATTGTPATPRRLTKLEVLHFIREHFAMVSALAIACGVVTATVFLYGYLTVFDRRLFWMVQYQDILTFGLIAIAVLGGSASFVMSMVNNLIYSGIHTDKPNWKLIAVMGGVFIVVMGLSYYGEYRTHDPHYGHINSLILLFLGAAGVAINSGNLIHRATIPTFGQVGWLLSVLVLCAFAFGNWLGWSLLDDKNSEWDVFLKNSTITQAKVVIVMSRDTVLYQDKTIYVVPTGDVKQMKKHE